MDELTIALLLLAIGFILIVLELFIPSGGILGIGSVVCIIAGIIFAFYGGIQQGSIVLTFTVLFVPVFLYGMLKLWPHTAIGRRILIQPRSKGENDDDSDPSLALKKLIGCIGVAKSPMLPSGMIVIDEQRYDSVSDGISIEVGQKVEVIDVRTNRLIVRPYQKNSNQMESQSNHLPSKADDVLAHPIEEFGLDALDDPLA